MGLGRLGGQQRPAHSGPQLFAAQPQLPGEQAAADASALRTARLQTGAGLGLAAGGLIANHIGTQQGLEALEGVEEAQQRRLGLFDQRVAGLVDGLVDEPVLAVGEPRAAELAQTQTGAAPLVNLRGAGARAAAAQGGRRARRVSNLAARREAILRGAEEALRRHGNRSADLNQRIGIERQLARASAQPLAAERQAAALRGSELRALGKIGATVGPSLAQRGLFALA